MSTSEVVRLLAIETADLRDPKLERLLVTVVCSPDSAHVVISNVDSKRQAERLLSMRDTGQAGAERVIALTASKLLVNSWLELFTRAPEPPPSKTVVVEVEKSRNLDISARAGVTLRDPATPFLLYGGGLRFGFAVAERVRLLADLAFDAGIATREVGQVTGMLAGAGAGIGYSPIRAGAFSLELALVLAVRYGRLEGFPGDGPYFGSAASGFAGEAKLSVGPAFRVGSFKLGVDLGGGYAFPAMEGRVAGAKPTRLSGFSGSASLVGEACL